MQKISIVIITKNEEEALRNCLESVKDFDEIIIVDSFSTDNTVSIAKEYTDKIFLRKFDDFSSQKNFTLTKCRNDWVLLLDADEVLSEQLKEKIKSSILNSESGYRIKRKTYIFGRLLKYGGHSNDAPLRLFDKRKANFVQPIHEFVRISGEVGFIKEPIIHYSTRNLNEYTNKLNLYTDLEAKFMKEKNLRFSYLGLIFYPIFRFLQRYILQRGFLDGYEGFIFYTMSAFYDFVKWTKYCQQK
jgi:glycosyltransferase involved in cell wall biosynthesis